MVPAFNFLLVKDPHFMFGFRSGVRKHGWEKDIDAKIDQIIDYAVSNNIKYLFFTGDVFEKNKKKDWSFNQLQQNKNRLKRFKKNGIKVYSNMGNHDYFDGHETPEGTIFGEMVEAGLINYIGTGMPPVTVEITPAETFYDEKKYFNLYGIDHHQSIDKILDELGRISSDPGAGIPKGVKMVLMHSNITDKNIRLTDFTYDQLSLYNIDIVGCGHWHLMPECGPIAKVNDTYFLNPWNLTRVTRDYNVKLDEHRPAMIHGKVIPIGDEYSFEFKEIPIKFKPFSEAFNTDVINLLQELGKSEFQFFEEIDLSQEDDLNDDNKLIVSLAEIYDIPPRSVEIAKELLQ